MKVVECGIHGPRKTTFVCAHAVSSLVDRRPRGFFWTDVDDDEPCGWCFECHARYLAEGKEWTGEAERMLDTKVLCIDCFRSLIKLNGLQ